MVPGVKSPAELVDRFRSEGLKVTPQREAVFRALHGSQVHPTAEAVHAQVARDLPMVSLRTVYQTLNDLTAMGELVHLDVGTGSARFDPNLDPHQHLVCDTCGGVTDIAVDVPEIDVPPGVDEGFAITRTEIVFRGRCAPCSAPPSGRRARRSPTTKTNPTKEARERHG